MIDWIVANAWTIITAVVVICLIVTAIKGLFKIAAFIFALIVFIVGIQWFIPIFNQLWPM